MGEQASRKSLGATLSSLRRPSLSPFALNKAQLHRGGGWRTTAVTMAGLPLPSLVIKLPSSLPLFLAFLNLLLLLLLLAVVAAAACFAPMKIVSMFGSQKQVVSSLAINHGWLCAHEINLSLKAVSFFLSVCFLAGFCFAEIWNFGYLHHHRQPVILTLTAMQQQQQQQCRHANNIQGKRHFGPVVKRRRLLLLLR